MKIQYSSFKKILLTFFLLTGVLASAGNYHIDGYVVVEDYYNAVSNEMVNIHDQNGTLIFSTITDNNGYYSGDFSADTSFVTVVVNRFCDGELTTYSKAIQLDDSVLTCSFLVCKEEPCDVYFNWAQQSASSLSIAFESLSMSEITSWVWDFGDGNFSGEENPVHEYDAEGLYIVQLFVTGPCGPRSFNDQVLVVYHGNCMAEFSYDPVASGTNYVYQFHDQSTGEITEWSWEFGGVGFSNQQNPLFDLQTPGPHFVNLQIFGNQCVDVKSKFIIVEPASTCFPHFNYNQSLGTYTISFTDLSISDSINGWLWDFGDGYTGDQQNPSHTYDTPGIYDVSLTIGGSSCLNNTFTRTVKVEAIGNCTADFSFGQPDPGLPVVEFQNLSSGESPGFLWNFGDGTFSNELSPTHTFLASGSYEVTLYLNDINCVDSVKKQVDVTEADTCEAAFSFTQPFPQSKVITFINGSSGLNFSSSWDFGDGTTSVATSPVHEYAAAGQYEVSLAIHTGGGCYDTAWKTLEILPPFSLSGSVWAGENPLTFGDVLLYFYDEQGQTALFETYELTDGTFQFSELLPGNYFLGAIPDFDFPYPVIPKYFPTYSGDRMKWAFAQVFNTGNLPGNVSVHLQSFDGFFNGKATVDGTIVADSEFSDIPLIIILYSGTGDLRDYRIVDQQNTFSFEDIPYGKYHLYPEKAGKSGEPFTVNLSEEKPEVHNIVFLESGHSIVPDLTFIETHQKPSVHFTPNPADDHLLISIDDHAASSGYNHVTIFSAAQRIVRDFSFAGNVAETDVSTLKPGIYLVQLTTAGQKIRKKIIIMH